VVREASAYGQTGFDDRAELPGCLDSRVVPTEFEAQRIVDLARAGSTEAGRPPCARIGRESINVLHRETGVVDRREAGIERELQR
jgi:hypothetical protein